MDAQEQVEGQTPAPVGRSGRPVALWAVLAVVALVLGGLALVAGDDDRAPDLPVALDGSGATAREVDVAAQAADAAGAAVTYVPGPDLPALGGEAPAYRLTGPVDEARVRALADALGLDGTVTHEAGVWSMVGDDVLEVQDTGAWWFNAGVAATPPPTSGDVACSEPVDDTAEIDCAARAGSGSSGSAGSDGDAAVSGSDGGDAADGEETAAVAGEWHLGDHVGCAGVRHRHRGGSSTEPGAAGGASVDDPTSDEPCPEPAVDEVISSCGVAAPDEPVSEVSESEATRIALDVAAAAGADVSGAAVAATASGGTWQVAVELRLDGVPTNLITVVAVGPDGTVESASGQAGDPERVGTYPLLDTRAAIDRANQVVSAATTSADAPVSCDGGAAACDPGTTLATMSDPEVPTCKAQPDGREICEPVEPGISCPQLVPPEDGTVTAPEMDCTPPEAEPDDGVDEQPLQPLAPAEVVLVDAEVVLLTMAATDGTDATYLVPGYRFTDESGGRVDLPAVADEAVAPTSTTTLSTATTVPAETTSIPTTSTTAPEPEPGGLELGVGYYVDIDTAVRRWLLRPRRHHLDHR